LAAAVLASCATVAHLPQYYDLDVSKEGLDVLLQEPRKLFPKTFLAKDYQYITLLNHN